MTQGRDYGAAGRIGIGTPQANPTVEAEFAVLLPRPFSLHVSRLRSPAPDTAGRLVDYLERLDDSLAAFDTFRPDAFGFACTGSSYLLGRDREEAIVDAAAARAGFTVDTAAAAIAWAMKRRGVQRIAVVAPYPADLTEAGTRYWDSWGIAVTTVHRVETRSADTRTIYELQSADAVAALSRLDAAGAQAVLLSGTGLPTLPALINTATGLPLFSSNACLAARLLSRLGRDDLIDPETLRIAGWETRLAEAIDPAWSKTP